MRALRSDGLSIAPADSSRERSNATRSPVALLRRELNPRLRIAGIVMTLFDGRLALAHQVVEEVRARFADELLAPLIPRNVRLSEAPSHGLPVNLYDPTCRGAVAYAELASNLDRRLLGEAVVAPAPAGLGVSR